MAENLSADIEGRIRKIKTRRPLVALFEALANSIDAIRAQRKVDRLEDPGRIRIRLIRAAAQLTTDGTRDSHVDGFSIVDDGIGFTEENLKSFYHSDSTYKLDRGGKGIGRFTWLKFFAEARIESQFPGEQGPVLRRLSLTRHGVDRESDGAAEDGARSTVVELLRLHKDFRDKLPQSLEAIAETVVEHFISYLATGACPEIEIEDADERLSVNTYFREEYGPTTTSHEFNIQGRPFFLTGIRLFRGNHAHSLLLCANKRVAERSSLRRFIPAVTRKFTARDGTTFAYWGFVEGRYLDEATNEDRDGFRMPDTPPEDGTDLELPVSKEEIHQAALEKVRADLDAELAAVRAQNLSRAKEYAEKAPEYRNVIALRPEAVQEISKTGDREIDLELRKIQFDIEIDTARRARELLENTAPADEPTPELEDKIQQLMEQVTESGKANLTKYVSHRRVVLDLLAQRLKLRSDGKYSLEKAIHQLVFPMLKTSDQVPQDSQNLWLIDERLSFHSFLASDKPLSETPAATTSRKEPDIIIFDRPIAFHGEDDSFGVFQSIEIIEFKRPMLGSYTEDKNPATQVMEYIELIQEGKAKTPEGRVVKANESTYFTCHILCDLTPPLVKLLKRQEFHETPDGEGMSKVGGNHMAYIEIISYDKMIRLAQQRNRVLFKKLGIV